MSLWIWGYGKYGKEYIRYNGEKQDIIGIVDNNKEKIGSYVEDKYKVYSFEQFRNKCSIKNDKLIICVQKCEDILEQIEKADMSSVIYGFSKGGRVYYDITEFYGEIVYSQLGEEIGVRHYFDSHCGSGFQGVYVDVGCYHPYRYSNTAWAYARGWRGVNIDANPKTIKLFAKYRPEDINVNCGIGGHEGVMEYYCMESDACNTFDIQRSENAKVREVISMPVRRLDDVLVEAGIKKVDLLDIDVEGFDEEIIMSFDWKHFLPTVVLVEMSMPIEKVLTSNIHKKLTKEGYTFKNYFVVTAMYVRNNT